jgi:hypothetical protein
MEKRPLPLTIIGWWMIISALLTAVSIATMGSNQVAMRMLEQMHVSLQFQQALGAAGVIVALASAYGLFKAQPWSRVLYIAWSIISTAIATVTSPIKSVLIFSVIIVLAIAYFLFRGDANRYFAAKGVQLKRGDG